MNKNTKEKLLERIKIVSSGCWEWQGRRHKQGYGLVGWNGKETCAHRTFYEIYKGPIPEGKEICHSCDNPPCCNPEHLWPGTHRQNMKDMVAKKRQTHGEGHFSSVLTEQQVAEIRAAKAASNKLHWGRMKFVRKFGVSENSIKSIINGTAWRYVALILLLLLPVKGFSDNSNADQNSAYYGFGCGIAICTYVWLMPSKLSPWAKLGIAAAAATAGGVGWEMVINGRGLNDPVTQERGASSLAGGVSYGGSVNLLTWYPTTFGKR